jgi:hypothetical protein
VAKPVNLMLKRAILRLSEAILNSRLNSKNIVVWD